MGEVTCGAVAGEQMWVIGGRSTWVVDGINSGVKQWRM